MRLKYTSVRARSAKVGSGTEADHLLARAPRVFWLMSWSFVVFSLLLLRFVVGRTRRASEILRLNLLDIELRYALAHCFQNIFERWRFALDPSQRIDARYNKRSQIRTHQSALFQLLNYGGDLFLELEHHRGPLLVLLKRRAQ